MTREEAILYLEHTSSDDFNLEEQQIQNRLNAIQFLLKENQELRDKCNKLEQQCKNQKEVIDKTIGYIQENTCWELRTSKVLDILKEVSE